MTIIMTDEDYEEMERAERQRHDDKVKELLQEQRILSHNEINQFKKKCDENCKFYIRAKLYHQLYLENETLKVQIKKMKNDVKNNIKWADENKNNEMWHKLVVMFNEWGKQK